MEKIIPLIVDFSFEVLKAVTASVLTQIAQKKMNKNQKN